MDGGGGGDLSAGGGGDLRVAGDLSGDGGSGWLKLAPGTRWQIQLSGTVDVSVGAAVYDIDLFDTPQATIDMLQAMGKGVICYFSAGTYEDWRPDASQFPATVRGSALPDWPGEWWLDVRSPIVRDLMSARLDLAAQKRCDGVDPDNVDGYANDNGLGLTAADELDFNRFLTGAAHARGLAVGLKNDLDQIPELVADYDFAVNEQCAMYQECDTLAPFLAAGKSVLQIEYGDQTLADTICPDANAHDRDALVKNLSLDAFRIACR
jgi:hypothetical protein